MRLEPAVNSRGELRLAGDALEQNLPILRANLAEDLLSRSLFFHAHLLKGSGFREEQEWRLLSYITESGQEERNFRPNGSNVVPYRVFELSELHRNPIVEVILGPRHTSPREVIEKYLVHCGYENASVSCSEASYR